MTKFGFLFSGQGAQYIGMGKDLADNFKCCKEVFQSADEALNFSISNICFNGSKELLDKTENTQPAILTTSIAALKAIEVYDIKPSIVAGLSLGEYSALVCSKALEFEDAVKLVKKRGKYMQEAVPEGKGTMAAIIGIDKDTIISVCDKVSKKGIVEPANYNCPGQVVISGEIEAVDMACNELKKQGAKTVKLAVSGPFHSSMLMPAAIKLEKELKNVTINQLEVPVITNVTGDFIEENSKIKSYLKKQVMTTVLWENTINKMIEEGIDTFIEIGPGKVLSTFVKKINRKIKVLNIEDIKSLNRALEKLQKS
ncbi:malonyl CoA-acyl carrier protein transacylase [Clostridium acetireducens DSM 10703]|jgi:[acyl-carrier-protein] S-malonyltransferase|uniref:Malonyl CoA-acyl carrier protein transacylase n=1 Tax=Clostridium acetireducens DSM 10703 TaxID=1121290 RepID=A0A1E8EZN8_9CLOT|nr:ACP S-malonyltransferase [Clostridium acetireducens]OFI06621.1 malonyl CoA-acyl carrier protein transacylase [Clostridium acetireducens DSM 10703]